jgi:hypothetical protein
MAKTKSNRNGGNIRGTWSNADHDARTAKRLASLNKKRQRQAQQQHQQSCDNDDDDDNDSTRRKPGSDAEQPLHRIRLKRKAGRDANHRLSAQVPNNVYKRTHLAHDDIESSRLRLVTSRLQRRVDDLRAQLEDWDPTEDHSLLLSDLEDGRKSSSSSSSSNVTHRMELDAHNRQMDRVARQQATAEHTLLQAQHGVNSSLHRRKNNLRKKPRPGPTSWKLRGAARPAYEVYDFDIRHVDVHRLALDVANARARRVVNVMKVCCGRFAMDDVVDNDTQQYDKDTVGETKSTTTTTFVPPQPYCRKYLSLLTQLGSIHLHRKNYSSARKYFLEAIELEGYDHPTSITNARYRLMNMYLSRNQPNSARRLCERLHTDTSAWIRYSAALIDYVSWNILHEKGSTARIAEMSLIRAIRGNVFVAYFLGWSSMFEKAMEYTNEVVESGIMVGKDSGSLLEAIEYACRCYSTSTRGDDNAPSGDDDNDDDDDDKDVGMAMWLGTEGSLDWVRSVVLRVLNESNDIHNNEGSSLGPERLTKSDLLCWESRLQKEEQDFEKERKEKKDLTSTDVGEDADHDKDVDHDEDVSGDGDDDDEEEEPDVLMYAGMFRTSMDWLEDAGEFLMEPSFAYVTMAETPSDEGSGAASGDDDNKNKDKKVQDGGDSSSEDNTSCSGSESSSRS